MLIKWMLRIVYSHLCACIFSPFIHGFIICVCNENTHSLTVDAQFMFNYREMFIQVMLRVGVQVSECVLLFHSVVFLHFNIFSPDE